MKLIVIITIFLSLANCSKSTNEATENPIETPTQVENEVDFWLTKSDATVKLQKQDVVLAFGSTYNNYANIEVDDAQIFQAVDGFGFSLTGGSAEVINGLISSKKQELLQKLFGATENSIAIIWAKRNEEEQNIYRTLRDCQGETKLITGATKLDERIEIINAFRSGEVDRIVSKAQILGWGVNLQQAEKHVYSGFDFSFESFYQAIRRSHRYGRKGRLQLDIPCIEAERPIWSTIEKKTKTFTFDCNELQNRFSSSF